MRSCASTCRATTWSSFSGLAFLPSPPLSCSQRSSALRNQPAATSYTPNVLVSLFKDLPRFSCNHLLAQTSPDRHSRAGVEDLKVYEQLKYALFLLNPRDLSDVQAAAIAIAMVKVTARVVAPRGPVRLIFAQLQWREQDIWEFVVLAVRDRSETINPQVEKNMRS
eukprot:750757-Hanusia_phi.AAC.1